MSARPLPEPRDAQQLRLPRAGRVLENIEGFLGLVGFVALFLGAIGVASAVNVYIRQKIPTVAVLRCLGASARGSFAVYLTQGVALGVVGAVLGAALGVAVQSALPRLLRDVLPFDVTFFIAWPSVAWGMGAGLVISLLFTLLPLLAVRDVSPLVALRSAFAAASTRAVGELRSYAEWLRKERLPKADGSFAIGNDAFAEMLRAELIDLTPQQVLDIGLRELAAEEKRFADAARVIDPTRPAPEVFLAVQKDHPTEQSLLPDTRRNLEAIRNFVVKQRLVTIPSEVRARVEATLPPFRATSFASMETPGPFETRATEAYYYVTPTEPEWPPAQKDEWLTAFNYYTTDVVSIHEAYPGHHLQLSAALERPTLSRILIEAPELVEGWGMYSELLMREHGFDATPEHRVALATDAIWRACRIVLDIRLHRGEIGVADAIELLIRETGFERPNATAEVQRYTATPTYQLSYLLGRELILRLRADEQRRLGDAFSLRRFHDAILWSGSIPVSFHRRLLAGEGGGPILPA